jgi:NAD(P)-dependent dehydrogenase (short-subunit alcohol dehydrogenase family)
MGDHASKEHGGKAVLVTGASTGIGEACARYFDDKGATVFAGVRRDEDGDRLRVGQSERLTPVLLDVTDSAQIDAAMKEIGERRGGAGLDGLVNNAGVARGGPLEYLPLDEWRSQFEINVFGQVAVTQAAMPMIREATGRIVFVGSIAGRVGTPFMGPYAASKHAIEAIGESLMHELRPWGIHVAVVEPGVIATAIWGKGNDTLDRLTDLLTPEARERYGHVIDDFRRDIAANDAKGIAPVAVAERVEHALFNAHPRPRYLVGSDARMAAFAKRVLPDPVMQFAVEKLN